MAARGRARHRLRIHQALDQLSASSEPDEGVLRDLAAAWSGEGYEADLRFLMEVARRGSRSRHGVLECGSGLTTLVLAAYSTSPVTTLEQHAPSFRKIQRCVDYLRASHVTVRHTPLRRYAEWDWYDWVPGQRDTFDLAVCDGPPGNTRGGRFGLMPALESNLTSGAIVLVDDVHRDQEADTVGRWIADYRLVREATLGSQREFAILRSESTG